MRVCHANTQRQQRDGERGHVHRGVGQPDGRQVVVAHMLLGGLAMSNSLASR